MGAAPAFVGVCSSADVVTSLKKLLLMFDKLAVVDLEGLKSGVSRMPQKLSAAQLEALEKGINPLKGYKPPKPKRNRALVADLEWLEKKNVVFEAAVNLDSVTWWPGEANNSANQIAPPLDNFIPNPEIPKELLPKVLRLVEEMHKEKYQSDRLNRALPHFMRGLDGVSVDPGTLTTMRIYSHTLRQTDGYDAVPVHFAIAQRGQELPPGKESVLRIVMPILPEPDGKTSLENILDFRSDEVAQSAFRELRHWIVELSKGSINVVDTLTEIERLVLNYERFMHLHHMETQKGLLELILVTPMETVEKLVKLQWSTLAKGLLRIESDKLALMKAEMEAPGREVAYLSMTNRRFPKRQSKV
jgi:hypothetical protein